MPTSTKTTKLPARLHTCYGVHLGIWLLARALDDARDAGFDGCGQATFRLEDAAATLNRSVSTVRRLLGGARAKGLLRHFETHKNVCTVYYSSLARIAVAVGLQELGGIGEIEAGEIQNLTVRATEIEAQSLQRESIHAAVEAEKERLKKAGRSKSACKQTRLIGPATLFCPPSVHLAGVLGRKNRWIYVTERFVPYGAHQESVARARGVSSRTVQRHLSNTYRFQPSPVRGYRSELDHCFKGQIAQRQKRSASPRSAEFWDSATAGELLYSYSRFFRAVDGRWFLARPNVYYPSQTLVRCRYRRAAILRKISKTYGTKIGRGGVDMIS